MIAISMLYIYTPYSVTLVPKKWSYFHNFQIRTELLKISKKTVPATGGNSKHILPSEIKKKKTHCKYNQAKKDETAGADDFRLKRKQMTPPSITGRLSACAPYDSKGKRWMEITDALTWWNHVIKK